MQRRNHGQPETPQEFQDVAACRAAENSVLMLQTNQVDVAKIQEVRRLSIGSKAILGKLEAHAGGVTVAFGRIVDRQCQKLGSPVFRVDRVAEVCREGRDATFARKIIPNHGDPARQHWPWQGRRGSRSIFFHYEGGKIDHLVSARGGQRISLISNAAGGVNSVYGAVLWK